MKTREDIITGMCYTVRHDYGLDRLPNSVLSSGLTSEERRALWHQMAQLFDNNIEPYMNFREEEVAGDI
jgi:hypothetical protein